MRYLKPKDTIDQTTKEYRLAEKLYLAFWVRNSESWPPFGTQAPAIKIMWINIAIDAYHHTDDKAF